ncbi:MAG: copper chaperone PCu(A)C [Rhodobacteraceae bacterium]|nr:copper chaperone PCu(A)C [Paracoccaceae bacterium]MCB2138345.1 copper chaperone PCu(A)C [Paracoccaceae bacterium]MCO5126229.1 copper chaperone PCu(A)C [Paracoccaceae bacterium]
MKSFKPALAALALAMATPAFAEDGMTISNAYARFMPGSKAGAAFFTIENHTGADDRLVSAASEVSMMVELHTHKQAADGTMQMVHVEEGFEVPAGGTHQLARGGDHVMFMGLKGDPGETVTVTLSFEHAGDMTVEIPVDNSR